MIIVMNINVLKTLPKSLKILVGIEFIAVFVSLVSLGIALTNKSLQGGSLISAAFGYWVISGISRREKNAISFEKFLIILQFLLLTALFVWSSLSNADVYVTIASIQISEMTGRVLTFFFLIVVIAKWLLLNMKDSKECISREFKTTK